MHNLRKQGTLSKQNDILCHKSRTYVIGLGRLARKLKDSHCQLVHHLNTVHANIPYNGRMKALIKTCFSVLKVQSRRTP